MRMRLDAESMVTAGGDVDYLVMTHEPTCKVPGDDAIKLELRKEYHFWWDRAWEQRDTDDLREKALQWNPDRQEASGRSGMGVSGDKRC